ncbi:MAG: hypothetical protein NZO58_09580, partial [Gemmataceae bacterium]|nr:hypothetical protein [Gemmataceae bacterium]
ADIPAEQRERYRRPGDDDRTPVQLDCASCHRVEQGWPDPSGSLPRGLAQPVRPAGAAMLPITYEQHCQACHPLTFPVPGESPVFASRESLRHRHQPGEVRGWLRGFFTAQLTKEFAPLLEQPLRPRPEQQAKQGALKAKLGDELERRINAAERILFGPSTCGKCHGPLTAEQRVTAEIPTVWYEHAQFDHGAHRSMACLTCHAGAAESRTQADVLVPGLVLCLHCHVREGPTAAPWVRGVRHDCVACHRYHDGDHPLRGRGAPVESPRP